MRTNQKYLDANISLPCHQNWPENISPLICCHCSRASKPLSILICQCVAGYSPLAPPSQSPPSLSSLLHSKQVMTQVANTPSPTSTASLSSLTGAAAISGQNKKYRPPHKTDKFTPKPIPPELGNLKTYSKFSSEQSSRAPDQGPPSPWIVTFSLICFNCFRLIFSALQLTKQLGELLSLNVHSALTMNLNV